MLTRSRSIGNVAILIAIVGLILTGPIGTLWAQDAVPGTLSGPSFGGTSPSSSPRPPIILGGAGKRTLHCLHLGPRYRAIGAESNHDGRPEGVACLQLIDERNACAPLATNLCLNIGSRNVVL